MSGEIIAILAVGVALAGVILNSNRGLRQDVRQDIARLESRLDERINGLDSRFDAMEKQFGELRERMAPAGRIARGHHRAGRSPLGEGTSCNVNEAGWFPACRALP